MNKVKIFPPPDQPMSDLFVGGCRVDASDGVDVPAGVALGYVMRGWICAPKDEDVLEAFAARVNATGEDSGTNEPVVETLVPDHDTEVE